MFHQDGILSVNPPLPTGTDLRLSWTSRPLGGFGVGGFGEGRFGTDTEHFQVYVNDGLVWSGTTKYCTIAMPTGLVQIDIGTVCAGEANTDFSSSLLPVPETRVKLSWIGGTYLDLSGGFSGFHVYQSPANDTINYATFVADIPGYIGGIVTDGFGYGGFGLGGFGQSSASYSWTSPSLTSGVYQFAVRAYDKAGNESTPVAQTVTINVPPLPPAQFAGEISRLHYSMIAGPRAILTWQPSPG